MQFTKQNKIALVAGSTGLVGSELLTQLLATDIYDKVVILVRRSVNISHPKLVVHKIDFHHLAQYRALIKCDDLFLCLGTTMKKAGSRDAFIRVDYTLPMILANIAYQNGAKQCLLVSSVGAQADSLIFYNKVKGQLEDDLKDINYWAIHIFRPSLLLGMRKDDRVMEGVGQYAAWRINKVAGGLLKSYKAVTGRHVATAMVRRAQHMKDGVYTYPSHVIEQIAKGK